MSQAASQQTYRELIYFGPYIYVQPSFPIRHNLSASRGRKCLEHPVRTLLSAPCSFSRWGKKLLDPNPAADNRTMQPHTYSHHINVVLPCCAQLPASAVNYLLVHRQARQAWMKIISRAAGICSFNYNQQPCTATATEIVGVVPLDTMYIYL